ncbi:DeoR/GlpR family DNA-binding transcription regulator [Orbus mooreae]|uniref:DeoR/GlpR family DNA-binding transcription regulator n=1 Tax=Orbus mooreae TaxID=3074107 RepID=UPI00370D8DD0
MKYVELTGNPRHDKLISLVMSNGYISNEELAQTLDVTPQTIRRDIRQLSDAGLISRHHGGAGRISSLINTEFSKRETSYMEEKNAIANEVASFIPDGATIFITIGTTVEFVAKALKNKNNLRIITNSIRVANILYQHKGFEIITVGGILRSHNGGIVGPSALSLVRGFRADYLITSLGAIDEDGTLLDFDINEVAVVKAMIEHSRNFILIGDHTKFHASAAVEIGNLKQVSTLITDSKPPASMMNILKENKVELRIAKK